MDLDAQEQKTCGGCRWFVDQGVPREGNAAVLGGPRLGQCRRMPPIAVVTIGADRMGGIANTVQTTYPQLVTTFPACGEYAARVLNGKELV